MAFISSSTFICMLCFIAWPAFSSSLQTYIVHVDTPDSLLSSESSDDLERYYRSFLPATTASADGGDARMVHSYRTVFKGFAARLSLEEVKEMEKKKGFIFAQPEKILPLHTTHSPNFLGLNSNTGLWRESNYGKGVIIGVLDTGILPEHPSFSDEGMPPPPAKWKGRCEFNHTACNNKIIGARYFGDDVVSPLDEDGHGTHTAGTAGGVFVRGANVFGSATGTAARIAPLAHLAVYRVCSPSCSESNVLAGLDAAVNDGVDIISISIGSLKNSLAQDYTALGAFGAMEKGNLVSCSAGNFGPLNFSTVNEAPWILTVGAVNVSHIDWRLKLRPSYNGVNVELNSHLTGAATIDRKLVATAVLGNNVKLQGESIFQPKDFSPELLPLVYAGDLNKSDPFIAFCFGSFKNTGIKGKIVVCEDGGVLAVEKVEAVKNAGGAAIILLRSRSYANDTFTETVAFPGTQLTYADGLKIKAYINSTSSPTATIDFRGTVIGDDRAPVVAAFSSRGPNFASRGILKPDILGPGVNILAAWPTSVENNTNTKSTFNILSDTWRHFRGIYCNLNIVKEGTYKKKKKKILSGTSMSCPHLSGIAALLKSAHPNWSPAAIKSAIMTTADVVNLAQHPIEDETFLPASIFATGAGHVNPAKANDPGLIYDIQPKDYIPYLCGLNYTDREVGFFLQRRVNCSEESSIPQGQLNYPAFTVIFEAQSSSSSQVYTRTVTNVGNPASSYKVEISAPPGVDVSVAPTTLDFSEVNQKMEYEVTFSQSTSAASSTVVQGFLRWTSDKNSVRSPIAVIFQ